MTIPPEPENLTHNSWLSRYQIPTVPSIRDGWLCHTAWYSHRNIFKRPLYSAKILEFIKLWRDMMPCEGVQELWANVVDQFRKIDFATLLAAQGAAAQAKADFQRLEAILEAELDVRAPHYSAEEHSDFIFFAVTHPRSIFVPEWIDASIKEFEDRFIRERELIAKRTKDPSGWKMGPEEFLPYLKKRNRQKLQYWAETWKAIAEEYKLWDERNWIVEQMRILPQEMLFDERDEAWDVVKRKHDLTSFCTGEYRRRNSLAERDDIHDFITLFLPRFDEKRFDEFLSLNVEKT